MIYGLIHYLYLNHTNTLFVFEQVRTANTEGEIFIAKNISFSVHLCDMEICLTGARYFNARSINCIAAGDRYNCGDAIL